MDKFQKPLSKWNKPDKKQDTKEFHSYKILLKIPDYSDRKYMTGFQWLGVGQGRRLAAKWHIGTFGVGRNVQCYNHGGN